MADQIAWMLQASMLGASLVLFLAAIHLRELVRAIASFAVGSALVAASFYVLLSPLAAVLQLTVGSGLIAVLFLVAITLTGGRERAEEAGA